MAQFILPMTNVDDNKTELNSESKYVTTDDGSFEILNSSSKIIARDTTKGDIDVTGRWGNTDDSEGLKLVLDPSLN